MQYRPPLEPSPVEIRTNLVPAGDFKQFGAIGRWLSLFRDITAAVTWPVGLGTDGNPHWIRTDASGRLLSNQTASTQIATGQLAVTVAAQQVIAANTARTGLVVTNTGAATVFLGTSAVTTATGQALPAGGSISITSQAAIYAIAAAGGNTVTYMEQS